MKKVALGFFFLFMLSSASVISSFENIVSKPLKPITMNQAREIYVLAIKKNVRVSLGNIEMYYKWSDEINDLDEKIDFAILWTLGQAGSYSDVVLEGIDEFMSLSAQKIKKEKCGTKEHKELALEGMIKLILIFEKIDSQKTYGEHKEIIILLKKIADEFLSEEQVCREPLNKNKQKIRI